MDDPTHRTYAGSGVDTDAAARGLSGLLRGLAPDAGGPPPDAGEPLVPDGFFAAVLRLGGGRALAISTDGIGSKSVIAQLTGDFAAAGWDCIAVNVNDVVCSGARPIALVDYVAVESPDEGMLTALGRGMRDGAARAGIAVVGGPRSQHPDTLTGPRAGYAFDIAGTCVGLLDDAAPITGSRIKPGDAVIGLPSDGIHANGLTLARRVLLGPGAGSAHRFLPECGRTVGEELLRRTHIYVPEVRALLGAGVDVRGLAHISGDGLLNLLRLDAEVEYRLDAPPPVPPVFEVIGREGNVDPAEMYRVFNMGVGFCAVVPAAEADAAIGAMAACGPASVIGTVGAGGRRVVLPTVGLVGENGAFAAAAF